MGSLYTDNINNEQSVVYLYSLASGKSTLITDEFFSIAIHQNSRRWEIFILRVKTEFQTQSRRIEWNFSYQDMENIYGYILQKDGANPFAIDEKYLANIPIEISDSDDEEENELIADIEKPEEKRGKR